MSTTEKQQVIQFTRDGNIAVIVIDNPPVNAGSLDVRAGLLAAIEQFGADASLRAAVLIGANNTFIAGSDIKEFGKPLQDPQLPAVIAAIENCGKPVIAALQGAALGGGYELALGCDARVIAPNTVVGLPEVTLGMLPGAGGTQRLPRLTGIAKAIELICAGQRVAAAQAVELKMADQLIEGDFLQGAIDFARAMPGKNRLRDKSVAGDDADAIVRAEQAGKKVAKNRPPALAAIASIKNAATLPIDQALQTERAEFQIFRVGPEATALRHLFFAERDAAKIALIKNIAPRKLNTAAVIGAGTMGVGIAACFADAGFTVQLVDRDLATANGGIDKLKALYARSVTSGKLAQADADARIARVAAAGDYSELGNIDIVVEAVFEDMAVKQAVFRELDKVLRADALLATNTSYLDIDALAAVTGRAPNVIGLHFFSPANVMKLLEIVRGKNSSPETLATGFTLAKRLKKLAVLSGNAFGFIGNRIYAAWRRQCEFMLEEGALPQEIDATMEQFGFAMGPFAVADMSGLDIAWRMRQQQTATRDAYARYVEIPDLLCEQDRLGQKTGAGYYRYAAGSRRGEVDPDVTDLIEMMSATKGFQRRTFTVQEIQARILITMVNEAALLLEEKIATRASDIDLVLVNGYGFPNWEGGPVFWARQQPPEILRAEQDKLAIVTGHGFCRGNLDLITQPDM
ncbi:MAG: 3-hydroxyacyl-CoA dehydrogenase NAD-binding domain-containing protein [Spongiibacteraceae bacterium]